MDKETLRKKIGESYVSLSKLPENVGGDLLKSLIEKERNPIIDLNDLLRSTDLWGLRYMSRLRAGPYHEDSRSMSELFERALELRGGFSLTKLIEFSEVEDLLKHDGSRNKYEDRVSPIAGLVRSVWKMGIRDDAYEHRRAWRELKGKLKTNPPKETVQEIMAEWEDGLKSIRYSSTTDMKSSQELWGIAMDLAQMSRGLDEESLTESNSMGRSLTRKGGVRDNFMEKSEPISTARSIMNIWAELSFIGKKWGMEEIPLSSFGDERTITRAVLRKDDLERDGFMWALIDLHKTPGNYEISEKVISKLMEFQDVPERNALLFKIGDRGGPVIGEQQALDRIFLKLWESEERGALIEWEVINRIFKKLSNLAGWGTVNGKNLSATLNFMEGIVEDDLKDFLKLSDKMLNGKTDFDFKQVLEMSQVLKESLILKEESGAPKNLPVKKRL